MSQSGVKRFYKNILGELFHALGMETTIPSNQSSFA